MNPAANFSEAYGVNPAVDCDTDDTVRKMQEQSHFRFYSIYTVASVAFLQATLDPLASTVRVLRPEPHAGVAALGREGVEPRLPVHEVLVPSSLVALFFGRT